MMFVDNLLAHITNVRYGCKTAIKIYRTQRRCSANGRIKPEYGVYASARFLLKMSFNFADKFIFRHIAYKRMNSVAVFE